ncbi:uncharacterized protein LOC142802692 [Rhipicephalus microplus]|uniref:uncharacterized protein LOC142802692 n=1 Tax=Rhipicephalus microplus TaxID=6941 RepID=UPI003F6CE22B
MDIDRMKRKRAVVRTSTTKLLNDIATMEDDASLGELEEKINLLTLKEDSLKELDREIEIGVEDDALEEEIACSENYKEKINVARTKVQLMLRELSCTNAASVSASLDRTSSSSDQRESSRNIPQVTPTVKLPKLEIAKFNGELRQWQGFWSQFDTTINANHHLSNVDKFKYLNSYLTGKAAAAVAGLDLSDGNYEVALSLLKERFGRKEAIIEDHMSRLLNIKSVRDSRNLSQLRSLVDEVERGVRSLTSLGVGVSTYGALLLTVVKKAVPADLHLEYCRRKGATTGGSELEAFAHFLRVEVEAREIIQRAETPRGMCVESSVENRNSTFKAARMSSAAALHTMTKERKGCLFCSSGCHESGDCDAEMSAADKREMLKRENRCFRCTVKGHTSRECRKAKWLRCANCSGKHLTAMCDPDFREYRGSGEQNASSPPATGQATVLKSSLGSEEKFMCMEGHRFLLQTARAWTVGPHKSTLVRLLLDGGSQRTFIHRKLSERLQLNVLGEEELKIYAFGDKSAITRTKARLVELWLQSQYDGKRARVEALEVPCICADIMAAPLKSVLLELSKFGLPVADVAQGDGSENIDLLIGADHYWEIVTGSTKRLTSKLMAVETAFGWTVQGQVGAKRSPGGCPSVAGVMRVAVSEQTNKEISAQLRSFWELEHIGIKEHEPARHQDAIQQHYKETVKFEHGRYTVSFPWKPMVDELDDNYECAAKRLRANTTRLLKGDSLIVEYDACIREYIEKGYAEPANKHCSASEGPVYYMPHQAVVRQESLTTKVRVVFDASSSAKDRLSLNDVLESGPKLNPELIDLLINFRTYNIGIVADIEKAFLQISLSEGDRNAVRFLWYAATPKKGEELPAVAAYRMTRVPFGVTSSPFLLAATLRHHLEGLPEQYAETANILRSHLYVDDLVTGVDTLEQGKVLCQESSDILSQAGMRLHKWMSNDHDLVNFIEDGNVAKRNANAELPAATKVLGVGWNAHTDNFEYNLTSLLEFLTTRADSKRFVLQVSARIFDPFGFIAPTTLYVKTMFQRLWELGAGWDDPLPELMQAEWKCWCEELQCIKAVSIPRIIARDFRDEKTEKVLHIFCDASPKAYGAVGYVACKSAQGIINISLIMAKSRVAPLKRLSLPRLELMGALIGARLCHYVAKALNLQNAAAILWTDSTVAMHWIKGNAARWKPFVANRVSEVQALTDPEDWRHCPGLDNPADLITRGILPSALLESELWWRGPHWLHKDKTHWPTTGEQSPGAVECHLEERKVTVMPVISSPFEAVLKVEEFSSCSRVVRLTAWVRRFVNNCRRGKERKGGPLRAEEVIDAERYWLATTQGEAFSDDISNLKAQRPLHKGSPVLPLSPYLDGEGLMRVGGRLQFTDNHEETKHPIILPSTHPFTLLLIRKEHVRMLHSGVRDTLASLRESYWIIRGRQAVKKVIKQCLICRKQSCPQATEPVAPLPADRVTEGNPFDTVGIDFAGPLICQESRGARKCYIAILTCAVTRAVHLELVSDMSTTAFLLAFKRFVARRGICSTIYSDNALTFKRAAKDLNAMFTLLKSEEMQSYFAGNQIRWKFIVERAAWWGGFWERLVRSVKVALRKVLGRSSLSFEELTTVLYEVEAVINSRPLTFTYDDAQEPEPLSPAHFLVGRKLTTLPPHHLPAEIPGGDAHISRRWKYRSAMAEGFWRRWRREYLLELRSAHLSRPTTSSDLKIDDLVLLKEDHLKRHMWKIARIKETFEGRDGRVRACSLKLSGGTVVKRPIQLLYPLEVDRQ